MLKIDPLVIIHRLNVSPTFTLIHQKKWVFARQGYSRRGLQVAGSRIHTRNVLSRLAGQHSDGKKGQHKVDDVCGLHELD